jgi:hypothetical protein
VPAVQGRPVLLRCVLETCLDNRWAQGEVRHTRKSSEKDASACIVMEAPGFRPPPRKHYVASRRVQNSYNVVLPRKM